MTNDMSVKKKKETLTAYTFVKTLYDNLKPKAEEIMKSDFLEDGIEKRMARIDGKTIGMLTVVKNKKVYEVTDPDAFVDWLESYDRGSCTHKANVKASDEIYEMLLKHYAPEEIDHLFFKEPVVYRETEKGIFACEDVCLMEGIPAVIPGIKPVTNTYKYMKVTDNSIDTCIQLLAGNKNTSTLALLTNTTKDATEEE